MTLLEINLLDHATPALRAKLARLAPQVLAGRIGPAVTENLRARLIARPPNAQGFPSRGFWKQAADSVAWSAENAGVAIRISQVGFRQRVLGGRISAGAGTSSATGAPTQYLAIPNTVEAYQNAPAEISGLKFIRFGRGADAPAAMVKVGNTAAARSEISSRIRAVKERRKLKGANTEKFSASLSKLRAERKRLALQDSDTTRLVFYWLKRSVNQVGDDTILPTRTEILEIAKGALA